MVDLKSKLKPCPFCGNEIDVVSITQRGNAGDRLVLNCRCCDIMFSIDEDEYVFAGRKKIRMGLSVIEKWNRREVIK